MNLGASARPTNLDAWAGSMHQNSHSCCSARPTKTFHATVGSPERVTSFGAFSQAVAKLRLLQPRGGSCYKALGTMAALTSAAPPCLSTLSYTGRWGVIGHPSSVQASHWSPLLTMK